MPLYKRLVERVLRENQISGVEVVYLPGGGIKVHYVVLERTREVISVKSKGVLHELEALSGLSLAGTSVALVLNGKGILHRPVTVPEGTFTLDEQRVRAVMPAAHPEDFYVQEYRTGQTSMISLSRCAPIDLVLDHIHQLGSQVVRIGLGNFVLAHVWPFITQQLESESLVLGGTRLTWEAGRIVRMDPATDSEAEQLEMLKVGGEEIESGYLTAYAAALGAIANLPEPGRMAVPKVRAGYLESNYRKLYRLGGMAALGFFFTLLLGNFMLYNQLSTQNSQLQEQMGSRKDQLARLVAMKQEVTDKRAFLQNAGWLFSSKSSYYADRLAATLPDGLYLSEISINPYESRESKDKRRAIFNMGAIMVKGTCGSPLQLNGWLQVLGKEKWVRKVADQSYTYEEAKQEGSFSFQIQVSEEH